MFTDHWKHSTEMSSPTCLRCFWVLCRGVTQHSKGLALSSFVFFLFFLKRNVSHLGFIFVFSEDYFLFSPFSFFWEDRLFTVDYRQKCCSPSYETAFFFSLKRRCCCTFSARSPFLSKQILPQHSSLRWLMPANGEGPVLPTSAGDLRCWPR